MSALDLFDDDFSSLSVDEVNERAARGDHGWNRLVEYDVDENALLRVVVSFDSEDDRDEFDRRFGALAVEENVEQIGLFELDDGGPDRETRGPDRGPSDRGPWVGLPRFVPGPARVSRTLEFRDADERAAFFERAAIRTVHKGTRGTLSVWWPDREKEDLSSLRFVDVAGVRPAHPVYVISKGRAATATTPKFLERDGVPFRLVVEPQEADAYRRAFPNAEVRTLPYCNVPGRGRGSFPARNWCWEDAKAAGAERHWLLDDNIGQIRRLYAGKRIPSDSGPAFRAVELFADRYENVAIAGMNYQMFVTPTSPALATNVHVYSGLLIRNDLPHRWRLRYNEDTDLCLQVLSDGFATVLVNVFMIDKKTTMTMRGGNSDELYAADAARAAMAKSLRAVWLDSGVVTVRRRYGRDAHVVDWGRFRNELRLRGVVELDALPDFDEVGLELRAVRDVRSPSLRRLLDEYRASPRDEVEEEEEAVETSGRPDESQLALPGLGDPWEGVCTAVERLLDRFETFRDVRFPIYVPSKGRAGKRLVTRFFDADELDYRIVVEPAEIDAYRAAGYPDGRLLELDRNDAGIAYARNRIGDDARARGDEFYWMFDDDLLGFGLRRRGERSPASARNALAFAEAIVGNFENVGGAALIAFAFAFSHRLPLHVNGQVYQAALLRSDVRARYRAGIHEDTDYSLQLLSEGLVTLGFTRVTQSSPSAGSNAGGNSAAEYAGAGRRRRFERLAEEWPEAKFRVVERNGRITVTPSRIWGRFPQRPILRPDSTLRETL